MCNHTPEEHEEIEKIWQRLHELGGVSGQAFVGTSMDHLERENVHAPDERPKPDIADLDLEKLKEAIRWILPQKEHPDQKYETENHDGARGFTLDPNNPDDVLKLAAFAEDTGWDLAISHAEEKMESL